MRLVYPPDGHRTWETSTFFIGSVTPGSTLTVNVDKVPVSSQGFFAWKASLGPGENHFAFEEHRSNGEVEQHSRIVYADAPPVFLASLADPTDLLPYILPGEDIGVQPREKVMLICPAPEGATVTCRIDGLIPEPITMTPLIMPPDTREGVFGQLHQVVPPWPGAVTFGASVHIPADASLRSNLTVTFTIQKGEHQWVLQASGTLTILPIEPQVVQVTRPEAVMRYLPVKGVRRTPALAGTFLEVTGFTGESYRVRYGPHDVAWVEKADVQPLDGGLYPSNVPIHLIHTEPDTMSFQVIIPMTRLIPLDVTLTPHQVRLSLYGAQSACDVIRYHPKASMQGLSQITWEQVNPEVMMIAIDLNSPLMGFDRRYDPTRNALVCTLKTHQSQALSPVVLALDPGHGGEEFGATAPDGTPEKDLNLTIALKLQERLAQQLPNLQVVLTRTVDETVSLSERVSRAMDAGANLLVSLHHNALPDGRNPLTEHGVSAYYYHPFALPFARRFQGFLVRETDFADYGVLYDSLHMCRVMAMPSILLELGFLTHPEDAARCLDEGHQGKVVSALTQAVSSALQVPWV